MPDMAGGMGPGDAQQEPTAGDGDSMGPGAAGGDTRAVQAPPGYQVREQVSQDAVGTTYKARKRSLNQMVALEMISEELAADQDFVSGFPRAMKVMSGIEHPGILKVIDAGKVGNTFYLSTDFVEGRSLEETLRERGKLPEDEALRIGMQVAQALDGAAAKDIAHGNLTPTSILLGFDGTVKVADMGVATAPQAIKVSLAKGGPVVDSVYYISPEQVRGEASDIRSDIYSLGAIMYRMLTGAAPFAGRDAASIVKARLDVRPGRVNEANPDVRPAVAELVETMMSADLAFRYPNTKELLTDFRILIEGANPDFATAEGPAREGSAATYDSAVIEPDTMEEVEAAVARAVAEGKSPADALAEIKSGAAQAPAPAPVPAKSHAGMIVALLVLGVIVAGAAALGVLYPGVWMPYYEKVKALVTGAEIETPAGPSEVAATPEGGEVVAPGGGETTEVVAPGPESPLDAEARGMLADLRKAFDAGRYKEVIDKVASVGAKYARTPSGREIMSLQSQAGEKLRQAETAAAELYDNALRMAGQDRYAEVVAAIDAAGESYTETRHAETIKAIRALRAEAAGKLEEIRRRQQEEEERDARYQGLLAEGKKALAIRRFDRALKSFEQAAEVKATEEVQGLVDKANRGRLLALAYAAEKKGDLREAQKQCQLARALGDDDELAARIDDLARRIALGDELAEARRLASAEDWGGARAAYARALGLANDEEAAGIRPETEKAEAEIGFRDLLGAARARLEEGRLFDASVNARKALALKPADPRAVELIDEISAARKAAGPEREITDSLGMSFVLVREGKFVMGDKRGDPDERRVRKVALGAYYIGKFEVTNAQFDAFLAERGQARRERLEQSPEDGMPAVMVTWEDANAFCEWLSGREGATYRLPTEAEWEMAARGADGRMYPWGNRPPEARGVWRCNVASGKDWEAAASDGFRFAAPVGSYSDFASPCGAQDMAGNVWEWCADALGGAEAAPGRAIRGGSFANGAAAARCSNRSMWDPRRPEASVGFRCLREADPIFVQPAQDD